MGEATGSAERPCSVMTCAAGEPLAGTAGAAPFAAIAWPKPLWHPDEALLSEGLPAALRALAEREKAAGRKLTLRVFQRAPRGSTARVELLLYARERGPSRLREVALEQVPERIARFVEGEPMGERLESPLVLVCTDGKHDRCCAAHGRPFYDALAAEIARRGRAIELAESSHLGGHRFAATCLVLPEGRMYGRLRPPDAAPLLDAVEGRRVFALRHRGAVGLPEPLQVAEAYVAARFPGARDVAVAASSASGGAHELELAFAVEERSHRLRVQCVRRDFHAPSSCDEEAETRARWVVQGVEDL